ncbi:MAG: zf-HC2 domain-containing protein [Elusimicrobiales bacterium]|jgi:hypothetical protein|nr:zf-HC2 domain-containing protein [Elusimicrobiales bacterium]
MKHSTCRKNLSAYYDGELLEDERHALEDHLAACPECRAELAQLRALSGVIKKHAMEPVPDSLKRSVFAPPRSAPRWLRPALAFAAVASVVVLVLNLTGPGEDGYMSVGFGSRSGEFHDPEPLPAADTGAAAEPAAGPAPAGEVRPPHMPEPSALQAGSGMPGSAAGPRSAGAVISAGPAPEFSAPVCVLVRGPASLDEADAEIGEALEFLKGAGARLAQVEPGRMLFVRTDGSRTELSGDDCSRCFILFDGVQTPLVVGDISSLRAAYAVYFSSAAR